MQSFLCTATHLSLAQLEQAWQRKLGPIRMQCTRQQGHQPINRWILELTGDSGDFVDSIQNRCFGFVCFLLVVTFSCFFFPARFSSFLLFLLSFPSSSSLFCFVWPNPTRCLFDSAENLPVSLPGFGSRPGSRISVRTCLAPFSRCSIKSSQKQTVRCCNPFFISRLFFFFPFPFHHFVFTFHFSPSPSLSLSIYLQSNGFFSGASGSYTQLSTSLDTTSA